MKVLSLTDLNIFKMAFSCKEPVNFDVARLRWLCKVRLSQSMKIVSFSTKQFEIFFFTYCKKIQKNETTQNVARGNGNKHLPNGTLIKENPN